MLRWLVENQLLEAPEAMDILGAALSDLEHGRTDAFIEARRMIEELRRELTHT